MGLQPRAVRRGGTSRVAFAGAFIIATFVVVTPCLAIETGQPPNLPPPPPPPMTTATPGTGGPAPAPKPQKQAAPAPAHSTSSSTTATASVSTSSAPAEADSVAGGPHALDTRWFIAPLVGFASDDLNFGLGVRGGKTLDDHLYLGGTFIFQTGADSLSAFYLGPEGGYDFDLRAVVVRPYMGLGLFDANGGGQSASRFVVWPGCTVIWNVPSSDWFLAGDARLITLPEVAFAMYFMGGLHFGS